jgi:hypothetical protein
MTRENLPDIKIIISALIKDIKAFDEQGKKIDLVCFTGDLINRGDKAEEQLELTMDYFIDPLLEAISLPHDRFLIIPGNHDIDRSKIDQFSEEGFRQKLKSRKDINSFFDNIENNVHHLSRTKDIREFISMLHQDSNLWSDPLTYTKKFDFDGISVGIACFDSSWRCSGENDLRSLIVGEREVDKALESLQGTDLKIGLVHHPLSWLVEDDERSVLPLFNQFHIVLNGHIHDLGGGKIITHGQSTIYSTCGALFSGERSNYNGYNFIEIDHQVGKVTFYLREYFDTPRRCFDKAISKCEDGIVELVLDKEDSSVGQALEIIHNITPLFIENINNLLVSNLVDSHAPNSFDSLFVTPNLDKYSEYIKGGFAEREEDTSLNLEELIQSVENIFFIGKEEIGKTTLLHYIANQYLKNYSQHLKVPFYLDFNDFLSGHSPIERKMLRFATDFFQGENTPTMGTINDLLEKNRCILLIDNINISNPKHIQRLNEFMVKYPHNRFIFTAKEDVFKSIIEELPKFDCDYQEVYIRTLTKSGIRDLTSKWLNGKSVDYDQLLDRILFYFNHVGMPRTPYAVSLVLATCSQYEGFIPINEANVMENFMEVVFEKLSINNTKINTYDFHAKEKFLAYVAWTIVKGNNRWISLTEFNRITSEYHDEKGLNLQKSKFDELFFNKGILLKRDNKVYFRYKSFQEYYLAKAAVINPSVLEWILQEENYNKHVNELSFYTGIKRDELSILTFIQEKLVKLIGPMSHKIKTLENYGLDPSLLPTSKDLGEKPLLTQMEKDEITNLPDKSKEVNPHEEVEEEEQRNSLLKIINLYGRAIRNSEDIKLIEKVEHLKYCFKGYVTLLGVFKEGVEAAVKEFKEESKTLDTTSIHEVENIIKYAIPFAMQNIAFESVGTSKLDKTLVELISTEKNEFIRFMMVFLYSDLKLEDYLISIRALLTTTENKDILLLIKVKLMIYYRIGHHTRKDEILNLIADTEQKILRTSGFLKSKRVKELKRQLQ